MWGKTRSHQKTYRNVFCCKKMKYCLLTSIFISIVTCVSFFDSVLSDQNNISKITSHVFFHFNDLIFPVPFQQPFRISRKPSESPNKTKPETEVAHRLGFRADLGATEKRAPAGYSALNFHCLPGILV